MSSREWYYVKTGTRNPVGPFADEQMAQFVESGELNDADHVCQKGMKQWVRLARVRGEFIGPSSRKPPPLPVARVPRTSARLADAPPLEAGHHADSAEGIRSVHASAAVGLEPVETFSGAGTVSRTGPVRGVLAATSNSLLAMTFLVGWLWPHSLGLSFLSYAKVFFLIELVVLLLSVPIDVCAGVFPWISRSAKGAVFAMLAFFAHFGIFVVIVILFIAPNSWWPLVYALVSLAAKLPTLFRGNGRVRGDQQFRWVPGLIRAAFGCFLNLVLWGLSIAVAALVTSVGGISLLNDEVLREVSALSQSPSGRFAETGLAFGVLYFLAQAVKEVVMAFREEALARFLERMRQKTRNAWHRI